jgi:uncharacterized membrane protein
MGTEGPKVTNLLWVLRLLVLVHTVALFFQAVFAGNFLDGSDSALGMHQVTGTSVITTISVLQVVVAVLCWRRRQVSPWFAVTSFGLFVGEMAQIGLGFTDQLSLHVPLGATALAVSLVLLLASLRHYGPGRGDRHKAGPKAA